MIILGLDGATFTLIDSWVEDGHLPNFARVLEEGVRGELESTIPEITVPAWPTFATGRNPSQLDMYGFTHFNRVTRENELSHDEYIPGKMWDVIDDQGGSSVVFNIPGAYPWQDISGTIIAAAPEHKDEWAYPPERWAELTDVVGEYKLRNDAPPGSQEYLDRSHELVDKRFDGFEYFIEEENPDLAVGLIRATDRIAHHYWGPDSIPPASSENPVFDVYHHVDNRLGEFLEGRDDEDILIISDHGFEKVQAKFAVNHIIESEGFVSLTESGDSTRIVLGKVRDFASDILARTGLLTAVRRHVPESALTGIPAGEDLGLDNALSTGRIDWENTRALADVGQKTAMIYTFADDHQTIETVCTGVQETLETAARQFDLSVRFHRLDRGGPHTPDLCMIIETPEVHATSRFDVDEPIIEVETSGHARKGIFIGYGPSFHGGRVDNASLVDIAPTVLHGLGYRLPSQMTGSILSVFQDGTAPAERDPEYYEYIPGSPRTGDGIETDEREEAVKDRLRELGYLE